MGKRYDKQFKIEAVRLASEPGNTLAGTEKDLGIGQGVVSRWKRGMQRDGNIQHWVTKILFSTNRTGNPAFAFSSAHFFVENSSLLKINRINCLGG